MCKEYDEDDCDDDDDYIDDDGGGGPSLPVKASCGADDPGLWPATASAHYSLPTHHYPQLFSTHHY